MATVDSGNETLFSDDSSCDLMASPASEGDHCNNDDSIDTAPKVAPPKIQPYSGVLDKGKVVIRPIAFKPVAMSPSARFGVSGERYGSTPILTRSESHLVHYGSSNDLRHHFDNYLLDRKHRMCPSVSVSSSPPLAMSSLTSLPHKLINYDSLESVRKSPGSVADGNTNKSSAYRMMSGHRGGIHLDLTPSPSDSGVSELEAALRDRDSELANLRQTMEHNEQVIFRVYQEKERAWERELRRLKSLQETRLRSSAQRILRLEQALQLQTHQLQQGRRRMCSESQRAASHLNQLRDEVGALRARLEDTEWGLCEKTGEVALLKTQLKEAQTEQQTKNHELVQVRSELREAKENLDRREEELCILCKEASDKDAEIDKLRSQLKNLNTQLRTANQSVNTNDYDTVERLKNELRDFRDELSEEAMSEYEGIENGRSLRALKQLEFCGESAEDIEIQRFNGMLPGSLPNLHCCSEVERLRQEINLRKKDFEQERVTWAQEKEKVLKYQRQLQLNYVQMFRRTRALETEVEGLSLELELNTKNGLKEALPALEIAQTVEL